METISPHEYSLQKEKNILEIRAKILEQAKQVIISPEDRNAEGKLLVSPEGPVSNLSELEWRMVRTAEFKEWFGESKIADNNNEPLITYRGNRVKGIIDYSEPKAHNGLQGDNFESSDLIGIYFTKRFNNARFFAEKPQDESETTNKGEVQKVFLKIEKPYIGTQTSNIRKDSPLVKEHDGAINEVSQEIVAFDPKQILVIPEKL